MFLLVSFRHVGAHPGGHQHGVSIQISINLGKTFLRISRIRNIPLTWILARVFVYVPPFISQILDFIYWTVLIFILIYFEWRDTENQQYPAAVSFIIMFKRLLNPLYPLGYSEGRWDTFKRANVTSLNFIRLLRIFFSSASNVWISLLYSRF